MSEAVAIPLPRRRRRRWRPPTEREWLAIVLCVSASLACALWVFLAVWWWPARIVAPLVGAFAGHVFAVYGPVAVRYLREPWD